MFKKAPKLQNPDMTLPLGDLRMTPLEGGARHIEINRTPAMSAAEVDKRVGFPIGDLAVAKALPSKIDLYEISPKADAESRKARLARQKDMTVYVFDEGESTGRHAAPDQPRYTIAGPHALEEIAAEANAPGGYIPKHAAAPKGYKGRRRAGRPAEQPAQQNPAPPARRHRAPIAQLGAGDSLEIGKERWIPAAGLDAISRDPDLQDHYERSGRVQGEYKVDQNGQMTYEDKGSNATLLFHKDRTPAEQRQHLVSQFAAQQRQASLARGQKRQEWEQANLPQQPYPPHADVYVNTATHAAPHIPSVFDEVPHQRPDYHDPTGEQPGAAPVGGRPLQPAG
jgi:hypothetical protein